MGNLVVRAGTLEDVDQAYVIMNEAKSTLPFLGGFTDKAQIGNGFTKRNEKGITAVVAERNEKIVGVSFTSPKDTHIELGLLAVDVPERRSGVGTALYTHHYLKAMLEGKLFLLDQILHFNDLMPPFLKANGFHHTVTLREKIRNFSSLHYYRFDLLNPEARMNPSSADIKLQWFQEYDDEFERSVVQMEKAGLAENVEQMELNRKFALSKVNV